MIIGITKERRITSLANFIGLVKSVISKFPCIKTAKKKYLIWHGGVGHLTGEEMFRSYKLLNTTCFSSGTTLLLLRQ